METKEIARAWPAPPGARCGCCREIRADSVPLVNDASGRRINACLRCLRSVIQMKVGVRDLSGRSVLLQFAGELGWPVWRADDALYLVPPVAPFASSTG